MITLRENVPLAPLTTFRVGGQARYYAEASGAIELSETFDYAEKHHLPLYVLGGGSNVLFSDQGFSGIVVRVVDGGIKVTGDRMSVGAGMSLLTVVTTAKDAALQGIEKLAGIPGSFGGAVRGNAGAFGTEIGDVVISVKALDRHTGMVHEYDRAACDFSYRKSIFKTNPTLVVLSAELKLTAGDQSLLERIMRETMATREAKHPQNAKCAGSFFMNPSVRDEHLLQEFEKDTGQASRNSKVPAGWLIDHVGLRGKRIGGAEVSQKHPNYLLNTGTATAADIVTLASLIKTRVRDELRVKLQEEVQYVGF
ncbi:MAG: UDP-N-acetylmuramate dehydrogenase [Candidatus Moranbacteria bacterium]|nr:UDP-N-acetylmuramate dehydrogenase [Candidatus Moranbacteria bacterium]